MGLKEKKLISLKEIDGPTTPHDALLKRAVDIRKEALAFVDNVDKLADYVGGKAESLGLHEDWAIRKEIFPGVEIHFIFNKSNDEFPASLRILYSGERLRGISGEDLVELTIACLNHMLRYVKQTVANPPEICSRV